MTTLLNIYGTWALVTTVPLAVFLVPLAIFDRIEIALEHRGDR